VSSFYDTDISMNDFSYTTLFISVSRMKLRIFTCVSQCLLGITAGNMFDGIFTGLMRLFKHELFRDLFISQSSSMYIPNEAILVYTWLLDTYLTWIYFLDLTKICPRPLVATALGIWKVLEFINTYTNRKHRFLSLEMTIETPYTMYMYNILICIETIYCLKWSSVKLIAIAFWFWIIL
jgi:hypothetical protein